MKRILMLVLAGMLFLSACGAKKVMGTDIEAQNYWARAAMKDGNGAAYMLLSNGAQTDDELVGVSCDIATAAEVHLSQMKADGTMEMIPQESVALPAGSTLEFKPGSYHVMLIGLKQELNTGDKIALTLHFKNHQDITLTVPIQDAANTGGSGMDGSMP